MISGASFRGGERDYSTVSTLGYGFFGHTFKLSPEVLILIASDYESYFLSFAYLSRIHLSQLGNCFGASFSAALLLSTQPGYGERALSFARASCSTKQSRKVKIQKSQKSG